MPVNTYYVEQTVQRAEQQAHVLKFHLRQMFRQVQLYYNVDICNIKHGLPKMPHRFLALPPSTAGLLAAVPVVFSLAAVPVVAAGAGAGASVGTAVLAAFFAVSVRMRI